MAFRLNDISVRTRLYALLIASTLGVAAVLGLALYLLGTYRVNGPVYEEILAGKQLEVDIKMPTLFAGPTYIALQEMETLTQDEEVRQKVAEFNRLVDVYHSRRDEWLARLPPNSAVRRRLEVDIHVPMAELIATAKSEYLPRIGKDAAAREQASKVLREKITPRFQAQRAAVRDTMQLLDAEATNRQEQAGSATRFWMNTMALVSVVTVLLGGGIGWYTIRDIVGTTRVLIERVGEMSSGASDLTARIPVHSGDEMGQLAEGINAMIARIQSIVARVRESSIQLLSTASEIAATAREQEATVQGQSSATAQVAAAVREITATSKELSTTMGEVNDRANQAAALAASGRSRLAGMETTMQQLVESTAAFSGKLATIRDKADGINLVVTTITKVADQTNLLSINAAIEAEKAGEYGRGFLVVAREIRRLADQTAVATLDIENMVRLMQDAVSTGVMQMDKFSDEVRSGVSRVAEINGQTGQIIEEVHGLTDRFHLVNESMRNQSIGAEQINEAMTSMTGNIRQTAAALQEFQKATTNLRSSVEILNQEIAQFKI